MQPPRRSILLLLAVTALVYAPSVRFGFVYDDPILIVNNPRIASWRYVPSYFQHHFWFNVSQTGSYYRPLVLLWLRLNYALFGPNPAPWHASTLVVHLVAVTLVYLLLRRAVQDFFVVFVATAVFALHPAHIESVAWIAGVSEPLVTVGILGSLLLWWRGRERQQRTLLITSILVFLVALLVKETAAITVILLAAISYGLERNKPALQRIGQALRDAAPFAIVLIGFLFLRWRVLRFEYAPAVRPMRAVLLNLPQIAWFYSRHMLWPVRLSTIYNFELVSNGSILPAVLVILIALGAGVYAARRSNTLFLAWTFTVVSIAPAIAGVVAFDPHDYVHDRYLYLPVIGVGLLLGEVLRRIPASKAEVFSQPATQSVPAILVVVALAYATTAQLAPWSNNLTLFTHAVRSAPDNPLGYEHLAFEMYKRNDPAAAMNLYKKSIALDPADWRANFGLAVLSLRLGQWQQADEFCGYANQISPDANNVCYQYQTVARMSLGDWRSAEEPIRKAIGLWPSEPNQHLLLGQILAKEGRTEEAQHEFEQELRIDPGSKAAQAELAKLRP